MTVNVNPLFDVLYATLSERRLCVKSCVVYDKSIGFARHLASNDREITQFKTYKGEVNPFSKRSLKRFSPKIAKSKRR